MMGAQGSGDGLGAQGDAGPTKAAAVGLLRHPLVAVNIGARDFAESLEVQGAQVVHVDWAPPAGGDREMIELLDQLL